MDLVRRGYRTNGGNDIGRRRSVTVADGNVAANMKDASLICPQMPEHETSRGRRLGFAGRVRRESARFRARKGGIRAKFRQGKGHQRAVKPPAVVFEYALYEFAMVRDCCCCPALLLRAVLPNKVDFRGHNRLRTTRFAGGKSSVRPMRPPSLDSGIYRASEEVRPEPFCFRATCCKLAQCLGG